MKKKLFLFPVLLLAITNGFSQVKKDETPKPTPTKIKVYTPTGAATRPGTNDSAYKWVVKTDLFAFVSGEFPIIYEYRIAPKFSVEGSAGITYAYLPNNIFSSTSSSDNIENQKAGIGSAFRGTIKYYPSSDYDAIEGWSFGLQLFYKSTNREYNEESSYSGLTDSKTKVGASLIIGKQIFADSNVTFQSYIGVGFANTTRKYYETNSSGTGLVDIETKDAAPNFQLGFQIGFGN